MHQKYRPKGLVTISVSLDLPEERAEAEKFLVKNHAAFTNLYLDESQEFWTEKFKISGPPCVYVFDRRGRWTQFKAEGAKEVSYAEIEKLVARLLAE